MAKKNGWYYAKEDFTGAVGWGATGSYFGPMGTALGIVIGGVGSSAWEWYWNQPSMIKLPDEKFTQKFDTLNEQVGFVHNEFIVEFVNDNLQVFKSSTEFVHTLHKPLLQKLSKSFAVAESEVEKIFDAKKLINNLDHFSKLSNEQDIETLIDGLVSIIQENYQSDKIPNYSKIILTETAYSKDLDVESYFNKKINEVKEDKNFDDLEKEIIYDSLNIFKYSLALWNQNVN
ncbi:MULTISPECIES: hypothetical protein [unclassified Myroides]|uniref:hypothetical protein n=1 Tax=unclassified Myroides TaxID=2642485 RepID=UPI003D2F968B